MSNIEPDVFEDRPFPEGVTTTDWAGVDWKELPPERVEYLTHKTRGSGKIAAFLSQIPVGQGRKRENVPDLKTLNAIRNSLYRAAQKVWGNRAIKIEVTHNEETGTYQVEFVHLSPEDKKNKQTKARTQVRREEKSKDELYNLCMLYATPTITGSALYNILKHGEINTVENLKRASLDEIAMFRRVGQEKLAVIAEMKEGLE